MLLLGGAALVRRTSATVLQSADAPEKSLESGPVRGWYFHGVSDEDAFRRICDGKDSLRIVEPKSDPGDLGRGVYLTKMKREAAMYGPDKTLRVMVNAKSALNLDFKGKGRHSSRAWFSAMQSLYGDPVQGRLHKMAAEYDAWEKGGMIGPEPPYQVRWKDRVEAADSWRNHLLSNGIDALKVSGWDFGDTIVLLDPDHQVEKIECPAKA